ncbi:hypothetical protein CAL7716_006770 [Calothrix sp. PCC 7716]|nr:hypothetical protein CAL7716_006770 [Calothrix sp. PCC 7716]
MSQMPTVAQLERQYCIVYQLTYFALQPIHLVCVDSRTRYLYIIAGNDEELEFQITPNGEVF